MTKRMGLVIKGTKETLSIPVGSESCDSEEKAVCRGTLRDWEQELPQLAARGNGKS